MLPCTSYDFLKKALMLLFSADPLLRKKLENRATQETNDFI